MINKTPAFWGRGLLLLLLVSSLFVAVYCCRPFNMLSLTWTALAGNRFSITAEASGLTGMQGKILHSAASYIWGGVRYWGQGADLKGMKWPKWGKIRVPRWKRAGGGKGKRAGLDIGILAKRFSSGSITDAMQIMAPVLLGMALALFGGSAVIRRAVKVPLKFDRAVWISGSAFLVIAAVFVSVRAGSISELLDLPMFFLSIWIAIGSLGLVFFAFGALFTLFPSFSREFSMLRTVKNGFIITGLGLAVIGFGIWLRMSAVESKGRLPITASVVESSVR